MHPGISLAFSLTNLGLAFQFNYIYLHYIIAVIIVIIKNNKLFKSVLYYIIY